MSQPTTLSAGSTGIDDAYAAALESASPSLRSRRKEAWERFHTLGMPSRRLERWRYVDPRPLSAHGFEMESGSPEARAEAAESATRAALVIESACRLVFVNGRFEAEASSLGALPSGVRVTTMASRLDDEEFIASIDTHDRYEDEPFAALNSATFVDGAVIEIASSTELDRPVHLVFTGCGEGAGLASPRVRIVAGANARCTVVEEHRDRRDAPRLEAAVTEIHSDAGAHVEHVCVIDGGEETLHVGSLRVRVAGPDARITTHGIVLGGRLVRRAIDGTLSASGCDITCNGLSVTRGCQHVDHALRIDHMQPHCTSWQYFKGILDDESSAAFTGRIFVAEDAQKTDAKQTNMSLLLSPNAHADTRPQLEIFADDVKCTHGATIGQLEPGQLFYLQARGISASAARTLLVFAFANEVLAAIANEPVRVALEGELVGRLPGGAMMRGLG